MDFFKVLEFQDYYPKDPIHWNGSVMTTTTYDHFRKTEKYNSFRFGSSVSGVFYVSEWQKYLEPNAKPFAFNAGGESLWMMSKKVSYIDEQGDTIKNALVVIDDNLINKTKPEFSMLKIAPPQLSKGSKLKYYSVFLKASLNPKFLVSYMDYSLFKTYRNYMKGSITPEGKYKWDGDPKTANTYWPYEKEIEEDSVAYYKKRFAQGVFCRHNPKVKWKHNKKVWHRKVTKEQRKLLHNIKTIFDKHHTNYKIVIPPSYHQLPMQKEFLVLLQQTFGKEKVYDFSGKNRSSEPVGNFYEETHFRTKVANDIMKIIYAK